MIPDDTQITLIFPRCELIVILAVIRTTMKAWPDLITALNLEEIAAKLELICYPKE